MTASTVAQYLAALPARIAAPHSAPCAFSIQLSEFQSFSISEEHMTNYVPARAGKSKLGYSSRARRIASGGDSAKKGSPRSVPSVKN